VSYMHICAHILSDPASAEALLTQHLVDYGPA
jgi:hypothetical protein